MNCRIERIASGPANAGPQKKTQRPKKKVRLIPSPDKMRKGKPCGDNKKA
jgi:hypothetical protein